MPGSPLVPAIAEAPSPALAADAPDPDVVQAGGTFYAFTTGSVWGNRIGVAVCFTKACPASGWRTASGTGVGSSALPQLPAWEQPDTQTSPGVVQLGSQWVMYYDAVDTANGHYCVTFALSPDPAGPYVDSSAGPLVCQESYGGSIDPMPFVDSAGRPWLDWKTNDGSSTQPAWLWAAPLAPDGLSLAGAPVQILFQDMGAHPWEATIENPDMAVYQGQYYLFFSGGLWDSSGYGQGYALCDGPSGPCRQPQEGPILSSYLSSPAPGGGVAGPGGGMAFADSRTGTDYFAYAGWDPGCTSYACGGARELFVAPLSFR